MRAWVIVVCGGFAIIAVLAGCADRQFDEFLAAPQSSLVPAGATRLQSGGHEAQDSLDGPVPAELFTIYGTNDDVDVVVHFYRERLERQGWSPVGGVSGIPGTHEREVEAWHKGGLTFRLGFWKVEEWRSRQTVGLTFSTIFDARLITNPGASGAG